jgi:hypothetical protein
MSMPSEEYELQHTLYEEDLMAVAVYIMWTLKTGRVS